MTLPLIGFALLLGAIAYIVKIEGEASAEKAHKRAAIIERAEKQHEALMNGDDCTGVYGDYPPANL